MTPFCLHLLAGARSNGANAYLLSTPEPTLLLDAGASTRALAGWVDQMAAPPSLLFLSHVHADHIGALPTLLERFGPIRCLAPPTTCALLPFALEGILRAQGHKKASRAARAKALAAIVSPLPFQTPFKVPLAQGELVLTALPSGHMPGASSLLVDMHQGAKFHRFFYLPDFSTHDQPLTPKATLPPAHPIVDTVLVEGALGDLDQLLPEHYATQLDALAAQLLGQRPRLLGVPALGVGAELVQWLKGQGRDQVTLHQGLRPMIDALGMTLDPRFVFADQTQARQILQAGGMVIAPGEHFDHGSPSRLLAEQIVGVKGALIACFNAVHKGSWIARALGTKQNGLIKPERLVRRAHIQRFLLPNHAPPQGHIAHIRALAPRHVILTHGKITALQALKRGLTEQVPGARVSVPEAGDMLPLELNARLML